MKIVAFLTTCQHSHPHATRNPTTVPMLAWLIPVPLLCASSHWDASQLPAASNVYHRPMAAARGLDVVLATVAALSVALATLDEVQRYTTVRKWTRRARSPRASWRKNTTRLPADMFGRLTPPRQRLHKYSISKISINMMRPATRR